MASLTRRQLFGAVSSPVLAGGGLAIPTGGLAINPRQSWAAGRPPQGSLDPEDVRFLIVHHSASHNGHTGAEAPGIIQGYYDYHTSAAKGWNDIAYNFLVDWEGGIWEGRAGSLGGPVAGDATGGNQGFTQLVCVMGKYDTAQPTDASLRSLVSLLAVLADRYEISTAPGAEVTFSSRGSNRHPAGVSVTTPTITGHRTMSQTSCPGDNLNDYVVGELTGDVAAARQPRTSSTTPPSTTTLPPTTTTMPPTSTTASQPTTTRPPSTAPLSDAPPPLGGPGVPLGIAGTAGALVLTGAGLLLWRQHRMRD